MPNGQMGRGAGYSGFAARPNLEPAPQPIVNAVSNLIKSSPDIAKDPVAIKTIADQYGSSADVVGNEIQRQHWQNQQDNSFLGKLGAGLGQSIGAFGHVLGNTFSQMFTHQGGQQNLGSLAIGLTPQGGAPQSQAMNYVQTIPHAVAGTISDVQRNGFGMAIGHLLPGVAAGLLTHSAAGLYFGESATAAEAITEANATAVENAMNVVNAARRSTFPLTGEAATQVENAVSTLNRLSPNWLDRVNLARQQELIDSGADTTIGRQATAEAERLQAKLDAADAAKASRQAEDLGRFNDSSKFNKSIEFARRLGNTPLADIVRVPLGGIRKFNAVLNSPEAQMAALMQSHTLAYADPTLWQYARQGKVIDANGNVVTVGDALANLLQAKDGMFHNILSKFFNFDLNYIVDDPFSRALKYRDEARSFAGFGGRLGKYFGGMGITGVGDVTRAYNQYGAVRNAVSYIASHSASEINSEFGRNMFGRGMLLELEKATTDQEVLNVFEDFTRAGALVGSTAPVMGWFKTFTAPLKGDLGRMYGTVGGILESGNELTKGIVSRVMEESGIDMTPDTPLFTGLNVAGKSQVITGRWLRRQFRDTPNWLNSATLKFTNRDIVPGSIEAVDGIVRLMRSLPGISDVEANTVGDILIHAAGDPNVYSRAYRAAMTELIMHGIRADMAHPEFLAVADALEKSVWEDASRLIGVDGGGYEGTYVATEVEWRDTTIGPFGPSNNGIGSSHLGVLRLPTVRQVIQLQRLYANVIQELRSYGAEKALTETTADLKSLKELADFKRETVDDILGTMAKVIREKRATVAEMWEKETLYQGYSKKAQALVRQYNGWLIDAAFKGLTRGEKVALVVKDMQDQLERINQQYGKLANEISTRLGIVPPAFEEASQKLLEWAEEHGHSPDSLIATLDHLRGERQAVEDLLANTKATLSTSLDSGVEIDSLAKAMSTMTELNAEKRTKFVKEFKAKWEAKQDETVFGLSALDKIAGGTGKRGLRNNREMFTDVLQAYNNKFFKPLTLTSPGWALRVSTSETMLNSFRIGGMNFFESHLAASIAKHEFKLADSVRELEALGNREKILLRNVVGGVMMGIEQRLLRAASDPQKARLVNDAVDLMLEHDGHLPMGMDHGSHNALTGENTAMSTLGKVYGTDENGKMVASYKYRGPKHTRINGNDAGAGTALSEALSRVYADEILGPVAKMLHNMAQQSGTAAFAANEDILMKRITDEAVRRIEQGTGKDAWAARNEFVNSLRNEVTGMSEFKALNEAEQREVLQTIADNAKSASDLVAEDFPRYMQGSYNAVNRRITHLEDSVKRTEENIKEAEAQVETLRKQWEAANASEPETMGLSEALDDADRRLRTLESTRTLLDKQIAEHPFRNFYTTLERGAALNPYKPVLSDLRRQLNDSVLESQRATEGRLRALLGDKPVALPRGGFAEMSDERMLSFRNSAGESIPNEEAYRQLFETNPELWSDNEMFSRWLPVGMPGVKGRDFLDAIGGHENVPEIVRLVKHEQHLSSVLDAMAANKFQKAYELLHTLDPTSVYQYTPALSGAVPDLERATETFSVNGVSPELILGYGRTQEKTLADLALHVRQQNYMRPNIFRRTFRPNYTMDEAGKVRFKEDFDKYFKALSSKTATPAEKDNAAKWFSMVVGKDPEAWATTAEKAWKMNMDAARVTAAREGQRSDYYKLLEQRKAVSADRSRIGVEKREILKRGGAIPEVSPELTQAETNLDQASRQVESLYNLRSSLDDKLTAAHARRDDMEQHVIRQDEKYRERVSKNAVKAYNARIRKGTKGMGPLMKRIESRTATMNAQLERQVRQVMDETMSGLSGKTIGGANFDATREALVEQAYAFLQSKSPEELIRYKRSVEPREVNSSGDPLLDWADDIVEHILTLSTGAKKKTFYPELAAQMATGETWSGEKTARWMSDEMKKGDYPSNIPARSFVSPFAAGSKSNVMTSLSSTIHTKWLAPIVNELVREPLFVWEYHTQMETLRPLVDARWYTIDQAKVLAKTKAIMNMERYVHDPLGKTVWEQNMRVVAPYYFAKNQALRRVFRTGEDHMAGAYKYLRLNLAVTNYVSAQHDKQGQFHVPGGEVLGMIAMGIASPLSTLLGYKTNMYSALNFGADANPASILSSIVTGESAGSYGVFRNMIAVPFGPVVTLPAKFVHEYVLHRNIFVGKVLEQLLGKTSMQTSFVADLMPNPFIRTGIVASTGFVNQSHASAYTSTENGVIRDMLTQSYDQMYAKAQKDYSRISSAQLAQFGSKEQLWSFYAGQYFAAYYNDKKNYQDMLDQANIRTAVLYGLKAIVSYSSPTAMSISAQMNANPELQAIMSEKDKKGQLKFPTYILAADEYMKRHPDRPFDLVGLTKSTGARWPETQEATQYLEQHTGLLDRYSNAMAYLLTNQQSKYDPAALQLEYTMDLRERQTPETFMHSLNISLGWQWYDKMVKMYKSNPDNLNDDGTLSYAASKQLNGQATLYGQTVNHDWFAEKNAGTRNTMAYKTYNEMQAMVKDKSASSAFSGSQLSDLKTLIGFRDTYEKMYNEAVVSGDSLGALRSNWYDACTKLADDPYWSKYSGFLTNVLRNLPRPQ